MAGLPNAGSVAHPDANEPLIEAYKEQVRRVILSATFRNAATLKLLLQFLADKTLGSSTESLKEYTIGVEALGRKPDFDPKVDTIVRVQSHRLRLRLKEYYEAEGSKDPILIQLPKGHYVPTFEPMPISLPTSIFTFADTSELEDDAVEGFPTGMPAEDATGESQRRWFFPAIAAFAIGMIALGYWLGRTREEKQLSAGGTAAVQASRGGIVESFWADFLGNDRSPVIAYPDAVFLLDDSNDLFRFRHGATDSRGALVDPHVAHEFASNPRLVAQAGHLYYENGYTGTGELKSVAMLGGLLGRMDIKPIIKSSRDVTPDDLSQHNVILLGSPFQNLAVAQMMTTGDFSFSNPDQHLEQWRGEILDAHPRSGEPSTYHTERDPASKVLKADYSLVTMVPGVTPGRWIAIIGGLDTEGTEGATMFITSEPGIERLNKVLGDRGDSKKDLIPFQALLRIRLAKGYQVLSADLISVHPIQTTQGAAPEK